MLPVSFKWPFREGGETVLPGTRWLFTVSLHIYHFCLSFGFDFLTAQFLNAILPGGRLQRTKEISLKMYDMLRNKQLIARGLV